MKKYKQFIAELLNTLEEESASGHPMKRVEKWMSVNGYSRQETKKKGAHPKYVHNTSGHVVTGSNDHGKVAKPDVVRAMIRGAKTHLGDKYIPIDSKIDRH